MESMERSSRKVRTGIVVSDAREKSRRHSQNNGN